MEALKADTDRRRRIWAEALEPQSGASFDVYIQNPYILPDRPDEYKARIRVSRAPADPPGQGIRLEPLVPGDAERLVFGDDEIYVANYKNRRAYDCDRPHYYPATDEAFLKANRPPSPQPIRSPAGLKALLGNGCFHCIERDSLFNKEGTPALGRIPTPFQAPDFGVAMAYAVARRALDIWKVYLGWGAEPEATPEKFAAAVVRPFPWHFREHWPRLEITPFMKENTIMPAGMAASGFGFVQLGCGQTDNYHTVPLANRAADDANDGQSGGTAWFIPYWLNPDVLVHEMGHHLLYGTLGFGRGVAMAEEGPIWREMWPPQETGDAFRAFHEGFSDIVAIVVSMHYPLFLEQVLRETKGDIFSANAATSVGEVSGRKTIRNTMNNVRMADVTDPAPGTRYYQISQVISGALFDVLAGFAVRYLDEYDQLGASIVAEWEKAFDPAVAADRSMPPEESLTHEVQDIYTNLPDGPAVVESAVVRARDALGWLLGAYLAERADGSFDPTGFSLAGLKHDLMETASRQDSPTLSGALKRHVVEQCFGWRGI
jgi:hypothetical protein